MDLLDGGRDTGVFRYRDGLVLRRYRDGRSAESEAAVMRDLARLGYPVPALESATGHDLVMEHVDGPTMAVQLLHGDLDAAEGGTLLAQVTTFPEIVTDSSATSELPDDGAAQLRGQLTSLLASFTKSTSPFAAHLDEVEASAETIPTRARSNSPG